MIHIAPSLGLLAGLSCAAFTTYSPAQVSPRENRTREGNGATVEPFNSANTPFHWLQVHDDVVGPATITSLSFRPDQASDVSAALFLCDISLSDAPVGVTAANLPGSFAACHGPSRVTHRINGAYQASIFQRGVPLPRSAVMTLTLPTPFALPAGKRLVWQVDILQRSTVGSDLCDSVQGSEPDVSWGEGFGDGCAYSSQVPDVSHGLSIGRNVNGINVIADILDAPPTSAAAFWFGTTPNLPPVALDTIRAPRCWLHVAPLLFTPGITTDSAGRASLDLGTLPLPTVSFNLYSQAIALAPTANQLGLVTSNGFHFYFAWATGTPPVGSLTHDVVTQTQPVRRPNEGLVVLFR